jgi:hypothetical protein
MRRRRSNSEGKKLPARSLGIANSTSPAAVDTSLGRCPLRWVVRDSLRSCGAAPITAVASVSINVYAKVTADSMRRSLAKLDKVLAGP